MSLLAAPSPNVAVSTVAEAPGFWKTVRLLLGSAHRRSAGRRRRQQELLNHRRGKTTSTNFGMLGFVFATLFMLVINGFAAFALYIAVTASQRVEAEHQGKIVVSGSFRNSVSVDTWARGEAGRQHLNLSDGVSLRLQPRYALEAKNIAREEGGSPQAIEQRLRASVLAHGDRDFTTTRQVERGIRAFRQGGPLPALLASIVLLWWSVMLIFQGEGLELDIQRRRHPLWEWLFSHPVQPGAVFLAEMLTPIAANPIYWGAPLFPAIVYGIIYGPAWGRSLSSSSEFRSASPPPALARPSKPESSCVSPSVPGEP